MDQTSKEAHTHDDVDFDNRAHHHTLGYGPGQAAPGNQLGALLKDLKTKPGTSLGYYAALVESFEDIDGTPYDFPDGLFSNTPVVVATVFNSVDNTFGVFAELVAVSEYGYTVRTWNGTDVFETNVFILAFPVSGT